jgi:DNA repair exonuclease SbcCD ATPase subunit
LDQEIWVRKEQIEEQKKRTAKILAQQVCPFCLRTIETTYRESIQMTLNNEEAVITTRIQEITNTVASLKGQKTKVDSEVLAITQQANLYQQNINEKADVDNKLATTQEKIQVYVEQLGQLHTIITETETQIADIAKILKSYDKSYIEVLKGDIRVLDSEIDRLTREIGKVDILQGQIVGKNKELVTAQLEAKEHSRAIAVLRHTSTIFSPKGIQKWLFLNTLAEITALTNSLLDPVGFVMRFQLEKPKASSEGFKPSFEIYVKKPNGEELPLHLLSGGEMTMVNFGLRLAFSTIIAVKNDFNFMIIDEGFHHLDSKNKEIVANMILQLSRQFQIFIVTHLVDFEAYFSNILIIQKEGDVSRVVY